MNIVKYICRKFAKKMIIYLDWILNKFNKYRHTLGISFFFAGAPLIYFFRDGLKLAQGSSAFTAGISIFSLLLAFPLNPKKLYHANTTGYLMCVAFSILSLTYLATYAPNIGWFTNPVTEIGNQIVFFTALFVFAGTSINTLKENFLRFTLIISFMGGVSLLYYISRNPAYVVGMRAAISFDDTAGGMASMGNPHIYAKSAYIGIVAGVLLLRSENRFLWRLAAQFCILTLFIVVALCQAMAVVLVTGLFLAIYFISSIKPKNIYKILKWIFGWQGILLFVLIALVINQIWNSKFFNDTFIHFYTILTDRLERIATSFLADENPIVSKYQIPTSDDSASQRIKTITTVVDTLNENIEDGNWFQVIFGHGYQHFYVDSPIIQTFHDLGILGFTIFTTLHIVIMRWVIKEIINPTCDFTLMIAYVFFVTLIQNFTFGMPYDYGRWCALAFTSRFALSYKKVLIGGKLVAQSNTTLPA
jgi:hypothetical protein